MRSGDPLRGIKNRIRRAERRARNRETRVSFDQFFPAHIRERARSAFSARRKLCAAAGEPDPADAAMGLLDRERLTVIAEDTPERARRDRAVCRAYREQQDIELDTEAEHARETLRAVKAPEAVEN